ncbi:MAG: hypothetical protein PHU63_03750, partial [Candidatus ainarchaeum sp.]|nr:hypothetical protein [Candidatus ainarchaeum sp.]
MRRKGNVIDLGRRKVAGQIDSVEGWNRDIKRSGLSVLEEKLLRMHGGVSIPKHGPVEFRSEMLLVERGLMERWR